MSGAQTGRWGEDYTADYLRRQGYTLLERNWHCRYGELDIIARRDDTLCFVEVKTRRSTSMVTPEEAITPAKRHKLFLSAECYLMEHFLPLQPRFDVAAVTVTTYPEIALADFMYYESAFEGEML